MWFFRKQLHQTEPPDELQQLRYKVEEIERQLNQWKEKKAEERPTVHVEHVQVDQLVVEKLELNNTFGQLGIKELSGKLNIGATTYGKWPLADDTETDGSIPNRASNHGVNRSTGSNKETPKVHMRGKK